VAYTNAIETAFELGQADTAWQFLAAFRKAYPEGAQAAFFQAFLTTAEGKYDSAAALFQALRVKHRGTPREVGPLGALSNLEAVRGRLGAARRWRQEQVRAARQIGQPWAVEAPPVEVQRLPDDADLALWVFGDGAKAAGLMDQYLRDPAVRRSQDWQPPATELAEFYARAGQVGRAKAALDRFTAGADSATRADPDMQWYVATAAIALAEGRYQDAINERLRGDEKDNECCSRGQFDLAVIHDRAGHPDSALAYFEQFLATPEVFRLNWDVRMRQSALRRLGELYEAKGNREQALSYYGQFVDLWKDADPELQPLVRDVKQRMAKLAGEGGPR
jgi:tetratricopeptide (TPR) repeat protein